MANNINLLSEWLLPIAKVTKKKSDLDNFYMVPKYRRQFCGDIHLNRNTQYDKYTCLITVNHTLHDEMGEGFGSWWLKYKSAIPRFPYPADYNSIRERPPSAQLVQQRPGGNAHLANFDIDENGLLPNGLIPMVRRRAIHPGEDLPSDDDDPNAYNLYRDDPPENYFNGGNRNRNRNGDGNANVNRNGNGQMNGNANGNINGHTNGNVNGVVNENGGGHDHQIPQYPEQELEQEQEQQLGPPIEAAIQNLELDNLGDEFDDLHELEHIPDDISAGEEMSASLPPLDPDLVIPTYKSEHPDDEYFYAEQVLKEFGNLFLAQPGLDDFFKHYHVIIIHLDADMLHSEALKLLLGYISATYPSKLVRLSLNFPILGMFFPQYFTELLEGGIIMGFDFPGVTFMDDQLDLTTVGNKSVNGEISYCFPDLTEVFQTVSRIDLSNTGTNRVKTPELTNLTLNITNSCKNWQLINLLRLFSAPKLEYLHIYSTNKDYQFESAKYEIDIVKVLKLFPDLKSLKIQSLLVNILFEKEENFKSHLKLLTITDYAADLDFEDWDLKYLNLLHLERINSKLTNLGHFLSRHQNLEDIRIMECGFIPLLQDISMRRLKRFILKYYGTESPIFLMSNLKCPSLKHLELTILRTNLSLSKLYAPNLIKLTYNCQHPTKVIDGKVRELVTIADEIHCSKLRWLCYTLGTRQEYEDLMASSITKHLTDFFPRYYGDEYIEPDEVRRWRMMLEEKVYPSQYHHFNMFQLNNRY
ncbi:hypothetical protein BN7_5321 [Wickerhamomyces ciferrii]|uniref:Uncharacterized protein n=1 Tax=Wickerhamomyces ciferrii (strain ATCC 14091 / BCRC 22168 / CBS 111 / JCM 3599 / NBRC 0793 / NRRL Y-1031 F-60-10) TaxID=1206466 RepID=K0KKL1_WICCF|nr:uncharacterized protein BN7_5321 [Wickerhamomyces ciferrii]CCH45735.1 hypothetical protein BN7_5321 [Wickerhamomyces ciferrii]